MSRKATAIEHLRESLSLLASSLDAQSEGIKVYRQQTGSPDRYEDGKSDAYAEVSRVLRTLAQRYGEIDGE